MCSLIEPATAKLNTSSVKAYYTESRVDVSKVVGRVFMGIKSQQTTVQRTQLVPKKPKSSALSSTSRAAAPSPTAAVLALHPAKALCSSTSPVKPTAPTSPLISVRIFVASHVQKKGWAVASTSQAITLQAKRGLPRPLSLIAVLQRRRSAALSKENRAKKVENLTCVGLACWARDLPTPQSLIHCTTADLLRLAHYQLNSRMHWRVCCLPLVPYRLWSDANHPQTQNGRSFS